MMMSTKIYTDQIRVLCDQIDAYVPPTPDPSPGPGPDPTPPPTPIPPTPTPTPPPVDTTGFSAVKYLAILDATPNAGVPWVVGPAPNRHVYTALAGHFYGHDCFVVAIDVPANVGSGAFGQIAFSDAPGSNNIMSRTVVLSEFPADFTRPIGGCANAVSSTATNGTLNFGVGPDMTGGVYPALPAGKTTYANFKNNEPDRVSGTGNWDLDIEFKNPRV